VTERQTDVRWVRLLLHLEIERQAGMALLAHDDMNAALSSNDRRRFWYSTQTFLSATANVSKLLWGTHRQAAADRKELRRELRVSDDSPLRNRRLRDHFEHFDERIVDYARAHPQVGWVDEHVGHPKDFGDPLLRCFEPEEECFWFYDEAFQLQPWVAALRDLRAIAQETRPF
jgi:hypothetical protein